MRHPERMMWGSHGPSARGWRSWPTRWCAFPVQSIGAWYQDFSQTPGEGVQRLEPGEAERRGERRLKQPQARHVPGQGTIATSHPSSSCLQRSMRAGPGHPGRQFSRLEPRGWWWLTRIQVDRGRRSRFWYRKVWRPRLCPGEPCGFDGNHSATSLAALLPGRHRLRRHPPLQPGSASWTAEGIGFVAADSQRCSLVGVPPVRTGGPWPGRERAARQRQRSPGSPNSGAT